MAIETAALQAAIGGAPTYRRGVVRLFGIPESEIANTLREAEKAGLSLDALEVTTCLRRGEIEVSTRYEPPAQEAYDELIGFIRSRHGDTLFSEDGSTIDEQVATMLGGHRIAVAESCTGGMLASRLTDRPGSSAYFVGGLVVYSNQAKVSLAGVEQELIGRFGAVSEQVAAALAQGAIERLDADIGVGVTGIAGPDGGSDEKPIGTVCFSVELQTADDVIDITRTVRLPGGRADVRDRSTTVALHLVRRLLRGETGVQLPGTPGHVSAQRR
jgi:nicotinamide-nucleotide amidase